MLSSSGYIAVDGTSLTVCDVGPDWFTFMLVAHTQSRVIIPNKRIGDRVNLEVWSPASSLGRRDVHVCHDCYSHLA